MTFLKKASKGYNAGLESKVAANSLVLENGDAISLTGGFVTKTLAGETIEGISTTNKTFAANNQTVAKAEVVYSPVVSEEEFRIQVAGGTTLVFVADLVTSNVINLSVNGVAMTPVTFITSNTATLDAIATQLQTQFSTVIQSAARSGTRTVAITVRPDNTVTLTGILVTLGASQTTGSQVENFRQLDVGDFYDIVNTTQLVDGMTNSATSGQLKFEKRIDQSFGIFSIANT